MTNRSRQAKRLLFPAKLWDLVHKPESGVKWSEDGTCIEVERAQLEKSFGNMFRSRNFDSFIRQLHFYGFRKAGNSYLHEKFQRHRFNEVLTMKRKYSNMTLDLRKSIKINNPPTVNNQDSYGELQAIVYSKKNRPTASKSPSKTLSKNQEVILVKVGHTSH